MQTPAEKHLIRVSTSFLSVKGTAVPPLILNIGAGKSTVIEDTLENKLDSFLCDRIDIDDCQVSLQHVRHCFQCSVESMRSIKTNEYDLAFANYILEHISRLNEAASEIYRVLKLGGVFVATVPNPTAPEIILSKWTPLWFHKMIRVEEAWETQYAYRDIKVLSDIFQGAGFKNVKIFYWSCLLVYLERFPILNKLAFLYDLILNKLRLKRFMNNVCIVFEKE